MKNFVELENALMLELKHWSDRQYREPWSSFYLYYMETTPEHDGGIVIFKDKPQNPDYKLATPTPIHKNATIEQNFNWLRLDVIDKLPVLSIR
jgi:hypothetical protein